jgi:hypothetical protein
MGEELAAEVLAGDRRGLATHHEDGAGVRWDDAGGGSLRK